MNDDGIDDGARGKVRDRARAAVGTGADLYRRASAAVARTGGDNGALTLLAAGAAVGAVSWLLLARRRRTRRGRTEA